MKFINYLLIFLFLSSCNLELNTTDPQLSSSILESISKKVFVCAYKGTVLNPLDTSFKVTEAWIEKSWKYTINSDNEPQVESFDSYMLIVKISSNKFNIDKHFFTWLLTDQMDNAFQVQNNVYGLDMKNDSLPKQIKVLVKQMSNLNLNHSTELFTFNLINGCK